MKEKIENKIKWFIEENRKICWESAYLNGEYCIGENTIKEFIYKLLDDIRKGKYED